MPKWPRKPCPFCGRVVTWGPKGDITLMHACGSKPEDLNYRPNWKGSSMTCGLCKQPIRGDERYTTDHYKCGCELTESFNKDIAKVTAERDRLRAALVGLIGASSREELAAMEVFMRSAPAPAEDKAASIDAIHALMATM